MSCAPTPGARWRWRWSTGQTLVENFWPGTMERLGLGHEEVTARNPGLSYCSISGFGGAGRDLPGHDFLVQAVGGLMRITGPEGGPPTKVGVALVDVITGLHAVIGVLAALRARAETGGGQPVELNLLSSLLASLVNQGLSYATAGVVPTRLAGLRGRVRPGAPGRRRGVPGAAGAARLWCR